MESDFHARSIALVRCLVPPCWSVYQLSLRWGRLLVGFGCLVKWCLFFLSFFFVLCGCLVALVLSIFSCCLFVCLCVRVFVFVHVLCLCLLIYSCALYVLSSFPSLSVAMVFTFKGKRNCTFCRTAACKV